MALDSRYVIAPSLQMYFVDKDTGLPLTNGQVYFYVDNGSGSNVPKDVFQLSGDPVFSYTVLPNPSTLSSVGTFQDDNGNDILPYYYPYDSQGNIELYYIAVYDSMGVLQFTRQGWPNFTSDNVDSNIDITNFVPNGQFLLHNNIPASAGNNNVVGEISQDVTVIAPGGWTFERGPSSTAIDIVTFPEFSSYIQNPTGNPLYGVQIQTTSAGTDTRKDLCLQFPNVNTFASDSQGYNLYFEAEAIGSTISNVQVIVRKYFGTGGSPSATTETVIDGVTLIGNSFGSFNVPILFGSNAGKTIGTNNDSYVQICLRLPPTNIQTALFTDFALILNDGALSSFPIQTQDQQITPSTIGSLPVPNPDGFDLYLPLVLTPSGTIADDSEVSNIVAGTTDIIPSTYLLCDGSSYLASGYSSIGIPYARLQRKAYVPTLFANKWGTGYSFVNVQVSSVSMATLILGQNTLGLTVNPTDGSIPTGFTFHTTAPDINVGTAGYDYVVNSNASGWVTMVSNFTGGTLNGHLITANTSGFSVLNYNDGLSGGYFAGTLFVTSGSALGNGSGAGKYFRFSSQGVDYYAWFFTAAETDPAVGVTGIRININANFTIEDVANIIANTLSGRQTNQIDCGAASTITAGSWFQFNSTGAITNVVWFKKAGLGAKPTVVGATNYIEVDLVGTETAAQVTTAIQVAINSYFVGVPDLRGMFLRGTDPTFEWDTEGNTRWSVINNRNSGLAGTFEFDQITKHNHPGSFIGGLDQNGSNGQFVRSGPIGTTPLALTIAADGGNETRPVNMSVNWIMKY